MKVLFAGDMSFNYYTEIPSKERAVSDVSEVSELFEKSDFSVLNLENILGNRDDYEPIIKSGPNLISDESFVEYINALNPTVVGLANNHTMDFGSGAMFNTVDILNKKGYKVIGAGENIHRAYEYAELEKDGVKCAIIAACENEFGVADETAAGTAGYSLSMAYKSIKKAVENGCIPVIYFHGGNEFNPFPSPKKTELYRNFIDLGAKAVIAMHTHCPQGYEVYNGCPIVYSMGNFFFPKSPDVVRPTWSRGYLTSIEFGRDSIDFEIIPYKFGFEGMEILKGAEKDEFMEYISFISGEIKDSKKLKDYFDSWCMMAGIGYADGLNFDERECENYTAETVKHMKNNLSCEAHNELLTNTIKIIYDGRMEETKKGIDKITKLQNYRL